MAGPAQIDHVAAGLGRLCQQFRDKPNIVALTTIFLRRYNDLEAAAFQVLLLRTIDQAVGAQLDTIGLIVGQLRNGLSDDDYRRYIRVRILVNRSDGTIGDLIGIAVAFLKNVIAAVPHVYREGTATCVVQVLNGATSDALALVLWQFLKAAASAGVRLVFEWADVAPAQQFTLDLGPGLDQGHLAGGLG